ncbi:MAG TPA: hypothetical protein PLX20_09940 [Rhodocyclaceae bacterium]|nr:hypothetical protein [Rhodocyclaceae bacterium]HMZ82807.1 hypothetical protein [Rhodocyclaceae bacterium]HNA02458.1 hypothetical protein [Rhodocyclaceae bacterium]HNB79847.1 hypothetical protein [Rhodocyclaceae bacterium]HNC60929.1 hypothetical protein [Rhodocyclaceae bacterium]
MPLPDVKCMRRLLACAAMLAAGAASAQGVPKVTYCCNDDNGVQVCSDQLPQICYKRAYRVLEGTTVVKRVEAPLSPEQRRQRQIEERRAAEEDRAIREQRRRDRILLDTYNSVQDIEAQRAKAIREIEQGMHQAQQELAELQKKRQALAEETEFYKRKPMPPELQASIRANEADIAAQQSIIDSKKKDIDAVHARFDEDKRRYIHLVRNAPKSPE